MVYFLGVHFDMHLSNTYKVCAMNSLIYLFYFSSCSGVDSICDYCKIRGDRSSNDIQILSGIADTDAAKGVFRIFECVFEAIPQAYLQTYVISTRGTDLDLNRGESH